jgi:hypothetical protein
MTVTSTIIPGNERKAAELQQKDRNKAIGRARVPVWFILFVAVFIGAEMFDA